MEASRRYLGHLLEAWNHTLGTTDESRLQEQLIVLTVPASFDEVARELTVQAAHAAGMRRVVLLEEPLAAFYAWLAAHEATWQQGMADGQTILVCDVGGGTADFSVLGVRQGEAGLRFDRLAVGDHLLLGGDNMDITLARHMEIQLMGEAGKLDSGRWQGLVYQCRRAKERLLAHPAEEVTITLVGVGGGLIGGTRSGKLSGATVAQLIVDGFFPHVPPDAAPQAARRRGLTELGLPYVQDPAITRHLAAFWARYADFLRGETGRAAVYPDFVLFNGGTLIPAAIRQRILAVVGEWFAAEAGPNWQPTELESPNLELAVALGAAYYGRVRLGEGVRVGSGSPRAYYVGVSAEGGTETAVCLIPRGTEEGFETELAQPTFQLLTNQPVSFRLFSSSTRLGDGLGEVVKLPPDEISELPPIRTVLRYGKGAVGKIPVRIGVHLSEIGTLALWLHAVESDHRWQLAFDLRSSADGVEAQPGEILDHGLIEAAQAEVTATYAGDADPGSLRERIETATGIAKDRWPTSLIRQLADTFIEGTDGRARSAAHEARWLNLLGFCLRPGYGDPVDEWRIKQLWRLHFSGLDHPRDANARHEWWILWRRVAGGLSAGQQAQMYHQLRLYLQPANQRKAPKNNFPKHISNAETQEIWMALANFERLPVAEKLGLGRQLLGEMGDSPDAKLLWALSRLGARTPVYGPLDRTLPAEEVATWVTKLLKRKLDHNTTTATALVLLARRTGDRTRDLPEAVRAEVARWLGEMRKPERFLEILTDPAATLSEAEESWVFGEALPTGLVLFQTTESTAESTQRQ